MKKTLLVLIALGLLAGAAHTQEPDPDGPTKLEIKTEDPSTLKDGAFAEFTVKTTFKAGDKIDWEITPTPVRAKRYGTVFVVDGVKGVTYTLKVQIINIGGGKNARWEKGVVEYTFGGKKVEPDPMPKDPDPVPKDPIPEPSGKYYFMVIRPDGNAHPDYTKVMSDPAWTTLRQKGHTVKEFTRTTALPWATMPEDMPYGVVTLQKTVNSKGEPVSHLVRPAIKLPTTTDGITKLPEGVK